MTFRFSQTLDPEAIHDVFAEYGYVHVPAILPLENAKRIHKGLLEQTPYNLVFNEKEKHFDVPDEHLRAMERSELNRLQSTIYAQARQGFQYSYHSYPIYDAYKAGQNKGHVLHRFYEWLNSDEFLEFARGVTGFDDISFVDAQATRYSPGQFLSTHDDVQEGKKRRAAYIFNFTPQWLADWGGYLQLLDDVGNVRCGLAPTFNALNIIAIPQRHNVSFVTPFASGVRLSVSGWLRYGQPE
jgi:Rps23 Pro-64 3,4-dihydroxylase Tpa1-like proline 4-hydroxylase